MKKFNIGNYKLPHMAPLNNNHAKKDLDMIQQIKQGLKL